MNKKNKSKKKKQSDVNWTIIAITLITSLLNFLTAILNYIGR